MKRQSLVEVAKKAANKPGEDHIEDSEEGDGRSLIYHGPRFKTAAELLEYTGVDMRIWEIERQTVNTWEVTGKLKSQLWARSNLQIKVWLRRKAPKIIQEGILELIKTWKPHKSFPTPPKRRGDRYLMAMHLSDLHFGKRCWEVDSGNNYDLKIAQETFHKGFEDLVSKCLRYAPNIDRIIFPIGNDFFHVNDWKSRTVNETRVESTDDRFPKVFDCGTRCILDGIDRLSEIAPVDVEWVPGNHDHHTSWHLAYLLQHTYRSATHIKVNINHRARKYYRYGCLLAGLTHGEIVKDAKLPTLMSHEAANMIDSGVRFREWWLGHLHKAKEVQFCSEDSEPNMTIRRLPSLCGTDGWHDQQGFTGTYKMAEAWLYSHDRGPEARFLTHA